MSVLWGSINPGPFWKWRKDFEIGGVTTHAGTRVTHNNALSTTAYYAGVTLIAQTLAQVPLPLYERLDRGKRKAREHQLYSLLHDAPNPYMNAFDFKEAMQGHAVNWGNAFAEIEWEGDTVKALWPLRPNQMTILWKDEALWYVYQLPNGDTAKVPASSIYHLKGFSADGIIGYDPLTMAREAIGLAKATEEFGARFFGGGTQLSGVLTHPGTLTDPARTNMRESWNKMHQGLSNQHRIAILEEGVKWEATGVPPENAQFLETRKFQTSEIARFLHIPPHMIGDLEKATFSNIEHQGIEFVVYTMTPWFARWEQSVTRKLLSMADRQKYFAEFLVTGLLRGDSESRARYYKERFYMGSLSPNEIREKENENPIPGGDNYYVPLNMMAVTATGPIPQDSKDSGSIKLKRLQAGLHRFRIAKAYQNTFKIKAQSLLTEEIKAIKKAAEQFLPGGKAISKKALNEWLNWLDEYYKQFGSTIQQRLLPEATVLAEDIQVAAANEINTSAGMTPELEQFIGEYLAAYNARHIDSSKGQLKGLMKETTDQPAEVINKRLGEWEDTRAEKISLNETVQLSCAVAKWTFISGGVTRLQWVAMGSKSCPLCQEMDGRIVGIQENFLNEGATLNAEGVSDLSLNRPTSHPPLHGGCVCVIIAA